MLLTFVLITTTSQYYALSQIGIPTIINHTKEDYSGSVSNWDVTASTSHVFVANGAGLLIYDGLDWQTHGLPNQSIARSVHASGDSVYVGGQDEVGYYTHKNGQWQFTSLRALIPEKHLPIEDVWDMRLSDNKLYFLSVDRIYIVSAERSTVIYSGYTAYGLTGNTEAVYYIDEGQGIMKIKGYESEVVLPNSELAGKKPIDLHYGSSGLYMVAADGLIYKVENRILRQAVKGYAATYIQEKQPQSISVNAEHMAIGTKYGGVVNLTNKGDISSILQKKDGLQNNNINQVHHDEHGNLWTATSNGIDQIVVNGQKAMIYPDGELQGQVYDVATVGNHIYFGTNNGLYHRDRSKDYDADNPYRLVAGTIGQVWGLDVIAGELLVAHQNGAFYVSGNTATKISPGIGYWKFLLAPDGRHMYAGTYYGVVLYKKTPTGWEYIKKYKLPEESCRIMINGKGNNVWVSHPYRGVYRLVIDDEMNLVHTDRYQGDKGLPSIYLNYIFDINGIPIVAAETGVYEYDAMNDGFKPNEFLGQHIPTDQNIRLLKSDENHDIWYVTTSEVCRLHKDNSTAWSKLCYPELVGQFIGGFENLHLLSDSIVIACSDQGAMTYNTRQSHSDSTLKGYILGARTATGTFVTNNGTLAYKDNTVEIRYGNGHLRTDYTYSCYLKGYEDNYNDYTASQTRLYENLPYGNYEFYVKTMDSNRNESSPQMLSFKIAAPWYKSKLAIALYALLLMAFVSGLILIPKQQYQKDKAQLQIEKEEKQAEIERIKTEQLESEIEHQSAELASSTLHLVQKNATLNKVRQEIENIRKSTSDVDTKKQLKRVLSTLNDDERLEEEWENFSIHFDKVHSNFLQRLKGEYKQLSPKDQKLAAYLRMNLTTKEIAPLLNISVRGVEISRYRLRKKLALNSDTNLTEWMMNY